MYPLKVVLTALSISPLVPAMTIKLYRAVGCKGASMECSDIKQWTCCSKAQLARFTSAEFIGISPEEFGGIFRAKSGSPCGTCLKSDKGPRKGNLCLSAQNADGALWWFYPPGADSDYVGTTDFEEDAQNRNIGRCVYPDVITIGGHTFPVNYDTPENVTEALLAVFNANADYADIPAQLQELEIRVHTEL